MSWIAANGFAGQMVSQQLVLGATVERLLGCGSVVCEFQPGSPHPIRLVHFQFTDGWERAFSIHRNADGSMSLKVQQGPDDVYSRLSGFGETNTDPARLTFAWDAPTGSGRLSLENLRTGNIQQTAVHWPIAIPVIDGLRTIGGSPEVTVNDCVKMLALADHMVPVGPGVTIESTAEILTPQGMRRIGDLKPGDEVLTKAKGAMPIRHIITQSIPAVGHYRPILLRAPFFGLSQDLVVAAKQRLLIFGVETEYTFGKDSMLLKASELMGLPGVSYCGDQDLIEFSQVLLDSHECIQVSGAWVESLFIGRLAKQPQIVRASILSDIPASELPIHARRARPVLQDYERQALFGAMIA